VRRILEVNDISELVESDSAWHGMECHHLSIVGKSYVRQGCNMILYSRTVSRCSPFTYSGLQIVQ
jgi:hypothetical protein